MDDALGVTPMETDEALRAYVKAKEVAAELLRELQDALEPLSGKDSGAERLLAQLAEDRFNLVVLGAGSAARAPSSTPFWVDRSFPWPPFQ
ncbi:MAG TPA: hypothetical protein VL691_21655 [Vicinamibacteria bacterium]|nr:hypothetical protein [Vicinamibacteria bacterium]